MRKRDEVKVEVKRQPIKIIEREEVETEVLAKAITDIAEAAQTLLSGPLTKRAIFLLIRDSTTPPVALATIEAVLEAAADLKKRFVRGR